MIPVSDVIPPWKTPYVTRGLVGLNAAVFLYERSLSEAAQQQFFQQFGIVPAAWSPPTVVTSLFVQGGWLLAIVNLLYLWIFGENVESRVGHVRFALLYLVCGAAAGLAHGAMLPYSSLPAVGASGAVAGVIAAYFVLFPQSRILTAVFLVIVFDVIEVPAFFFLGIWLLLQFVSGHGSFVSIPTRINVVFAAHLVGFIVGAIWGLLVRLRQRPTYF